MHDPAGADATAPILQKGCPCVCLQTLPSCSCWLWRGEGKGCVLVLVVSSVDVDMPCNLCDISVRAGAKQAAVQLGHCANSQVLFAAPKSTRSHRVPPMTRHCARPVRVVALSKAIWEPVLSTQGGSCAVDTRPAITPLVAWLHLEHQSFSRVPLRATIVQVVF